MGRTLICKLLLTHNRGVGAGIGNPTRRDGGAERERVQSKTIDMAGTAGDEIFVAIAHPVRRALLDRLASGEQTVSTLAEPFPISRPAISQHLRVLREAGLVEEQITGREHRYHLRPERLRVVRDWLRTYERFWRQRLEALGEYLDSEGREQ